jgi:hypothetical protein
MEGSGNDGTPSEALGSATIDAFRHDATNILELEPCRGCAAAARCANQLLACRDFLHFVETGGRNPSSDHERGPTRKIYNRLFAGTKPNDAAARWNARWL